MRSLSPNVTRVASLQIITIGWMLLECGVAVFSAWQAHSAVLLAFGVDSLVELLSAVVVILQFTTRFRLSASVAARWAGILLFALAAVIGLLSVAALLRRAHSKPSLAGIAITLAALVVMPLLSRAKRKAARETGNRALEADAVQSATCAYLAAISLLGLALNAIFRIPWIDPVAALAAVPVLCIEGRRSMQGHACGCC